MSDMFDDGAFAPPSAEDEIRKAQKYEAFQDSAMYREVMREMRAAVMAGFTQVPLRDTEGLLHCRLQYHALDSLDRLISDVVASGRMSEKAVAEAADEFSREMRGVAA